MSTHKKIVNDGKSQLVIEDIFLPSIFSFCMHIYRLDFFAVAYHRACIISNCNKYVFLIKESCIKKLLLHDEM